MAQLERALDLIELLTERGSASLTDLSQELHLPRATVYRLLQALMARGYVEHLKDTHTYTLGLNLRLLAARSQVSALQRIASSALADLRSVTQETVNLAVVQNGRVYYAASLEGSLLPRMSSIIGADIAPHATALGKAILAALPPDQRLSLLGPGPYRSCTPKTITDPLELGAEIERVRERGYAIDNEECDVGAICLAVAIFDGSHPVGAISISGVTARMTESVIAHYATLLVAWSQRISAQLRQEVP